MAAITGTPDGAASDATRGDEVAHRLERAREAATTAVYVGLSLLAVLVARPAGVASSASSSPALEILVTSVGLLLAHQLAFRVSARLAHRGQLTSEHLELLAIQLVAGATVTAVAVVPVLVLGPAGVVVAELMLIALIGVVAYVAIRTVPVGRRRALAYVTAVIALSLVVVGIKNLVAH